MDWFYALNKQQQGPVDGATLRALFQGGTINSESLVWYAGLDGWKPYGEVASAVEADSPAPPASPSEGGLPDYMASSGSAPAAIAPQDMATCAHSGKVAPKKDMLQYGEHWLLPENKDAFVAALQQGTAVLPGEVMTTLQPVGFWWRVLAYLIDSLIVGAVSMVCALPFILFGGLPILLEMMNNPGEMDPDMMAGSITGLVIGGILFVLLVIAFTVFYYIYLVGKNGATPGKRLLGFRIVTSEGAKVTYGRATGRFFAAIGLTIAGSTLGTILVFLIMIPLSSAGDTAAGIGAVLSQVVSFIASNLTYLWVAFDKKKRGLHDLVASTLVVRD